MAVRGMKASVSISSILNESLSDFSRSFFPLVGYEILIRILGFAAIAPLSAWLLRSVIGTTGRYAVGNTELITFAFSPIGLVFVLVTGVVVLFGLFLQHAGVIMIADAQGRGRKLSTLQTFWRVLLKIPAMFQLGLLQITHYGLIVLPVLALVGLAYWALWSDADLYFLTQVRPLVFWVGVIIAGLAVMVGSVLVAWLFLRWIIALPLLLIEGRNPRQSLRISAERTKGLTGRMTFLAIWTLIATLVGAIAAALFTLFSNGLLDRIPNALNVTLPTLAGLLAVHFLLIETLEIAGSIVVGLIIYRMACDHDLGAQCASRSIEPLPVASRIISNRRRLARRFSLILLAMVITASLFSLGLLSTIGVSPSVTITAHRGGSKTAPENTLAAIRGAIAAGADAAEIDVQLTSDGVVVVFHDEDLMRLANDPRRLADLTFDEVRSFDVGSWFGSEFQGERIPTLDEVLEVAGDQLQLNIELKMIRSQPDPAPLVHEVLACLDRHQARDRCVISTLSYPALAEVRRQASDIRVGFIVFEAMGDPTRLDLDFLSVRDAIATDDFIARARRRGRPVHVWTINDPDQFTMLVNRGVADVLTSHPAILVARRAELAELNDLERLLLWYRRVLSNR